MGGFLPKNIDTLPSGSVVYADGANIGFCKKIVLRSKGGERFAFFNYGNVSFHFMKGNYEGITKVEKVGKNFESLVGSDIEVSVGCCGSEEKSKFAVVTVEDF